MHRFVPDPTAADSSSAAEQAEAIRRWTRERLGLAEEVAVIVTDRPCADPGCPLVETTIAVFPPGDSPRQWKLTRPRHAVTRLMIQQLIP